MNEAIQDEDLAKEDLRRQERLAQERAPWEETYREIDERFPDGAGGFNTMTPGAIRGSRNYDSTHITALERFAAAMRSITTPDESGYIKPRFADENLMKSRRVQLWCQAGGDRLYRIRHAIHTGFATSAYEDWDQLGRYGTSPVWSEARKDGKGLFYRTLHLSQVWIDVDYSGLVDVVHRKWNCKARELEQFFGRDNLTPRMLDALNTPGKEDLEFEILHCVLPNTDYDAEKLDHRRFPIATRYLATAEKLYLRRGGYHTMPISVSRHMTSAGEKYGRSPAIKMMPNVQGVNAMKLTTLRAGHKAVDPALLFHDDDGVTKLVSKAGGMNPGMVDDQGRVLVHRMPGGEAGLPYAIDMIQAEQAQIKTGFLEEFYATLTDPNSRMTTTEVLERISKQGVLVRPFASRYAVEKQHPMTQRDLDLALRAGQIEPFPPEVIEAGAWPLIDYENPLAAMARAESTQKTLRFVEYATAIGTLAETPAADTVDIDEALREGALEIGVKPSLIRDRADVAKRRAAAEEAQGDAFDAELLEKNAGAMVDIAKAGQISQAA